MQFTLLLPLLLSNYFSQIESIESSIEFIDKNANSSEYVENQKIANVKGYEDLAEKCMKTCHLLKNKGDVRCEVDGSEVLCVCTGTGKMFDRKDKDCKQCVCGKNTKPCKIENGEAKCECLEGFYLVNGNCEDLTETCRKTCNLLANKGDVRCEVNGSEVLCVCTETGKMFDYKDKDCKQCVCGKNTKPCKIEDGKAKCECQDGFYLLDGNCEDLTETCMKKCNFLKNKGDVRCDVDGSEVLCVCTGSEKMFDSKDKDCKKCVCKKNTKPCRLENGKPKCECLDKYYMKDGICYELSKTCQEKCNLPANKEDVKCVADQFGDECVCKENEKMFDYQDKTCKPLSRNCLEICNLPKNMEDVKCVKNQSGEVCVCNEYRKMFHYKAKECKKLSKTCAVKCNLPQNEETVKCVENKFGEECVCIDDEKMFDYKDKSCKPLSKDCLDKCNLPKNKADLKCVKNETGAACVCNEYIKSFYYKAKECKALSRNCALKCNLPKKEGEIICTEKFSKDMYSISCHCTDPKTMFYYLTSDCKKCYCGEHTESCELGAYGHPKCKCKPNYYLVNGNCEVPSDECVTKCNLRATENVECLKNDSGLFCKCQEHEQEFDYEERKCKHCVCEANTKPCTIEGGKPKCECLDGFYLENGKCKVKTAVKGRHYGTWMLLNWLARGL